ncbi:Unknown protein [Striga hermonthica]|uniref:Uncharacterized protein n=1 Tax=Striga hermonthica TaxID=68872 RepID=A0A9N7MLU4_STRHE|nr:Unknown protein [Striga hermonthica]
MCRVCYVPLAACIMHVVLHVVLARPSWLESDEMDAEVCDDMAVILLQSHSKIKRDSFVVYANNVPGAPLPSGPPPNSHPKSWIIGLVLSLVLPFFTHKWGPLWVVKSRIDNAVQTVEDIVEAVEKVAEKVDEIAEDIAEDLPDGKLKDFVELIENVAEKTAKTADCIDNVIDKAQEAEDEVEEMISKSLVKKPKSSAKQ